MCLCSVILTLITCQGKGCKHRKRTPGFHPYIWIYLWEHRGDCGVCFSPSSCWFCKGVRANSGEIYRGGLQARGCETLKRMEHILWSIQVGVDKYGRRYCSKTAFSKIGLILLDPPSARSWFSCPLYHVQANLPVCLFKQQSDHFFDKWAYGA